MNSTKRNLPWITSAVALATLASGASANPPQIKPAGNTGGHPAPSAAAQPTAAPAPTPVHGGTHPGPNPGGIQLAPPTITRIFPFNVTTPRLGEAGTLVTVYGTSLNKTATVRFGNDSARVAAASAAPDGTWIKAVVPRTATSGKVQVTQDGKVYEFPSVIWVDDWRDTNGFSFSNSKAFQSNVGGYSWQDLIDVYGSDAVQLCGTITLPWPLSGSITGCIQDPFAWLYLGIINGPLQNGQCYGFTYASLRFQNGQQNLDAFPAWSGSDWAQPGRPTTVFRLQGPGPNNATDDPSRVSAALSHFIHLRHLEQTSGEFIGAYLTYSNGGNKDTLRGQILDSITHGSGGVLVLTRCSHVLQPFDLQDTTGGGYQIWAYDPNVPFQVGETTPDRSVQSAVRVDPLGNYWFADKSGETCNGGVDELKVFPASTVPVRPSIPTAQGAVDALVHSIAGGAASVSQITDAQGKMLLAPDGSENKNAATRMPKSGVFYGLGGFGRGAEPIYVLNGHGPYTQTITGKSSGSYSLTFLGKDFGAKLENVPSQAGGHDELTVDRGGASVELKTVTHAKQVKLTAIAKNASKLPRTVTLTTSSKPNESLRLAFDAAHETVTYTHLGSPTTFTVELTSVDAKAQPNRATSSGMSVEKGDVITFKPVWHQLASGVQMHVKKANGVESDLKMR